MEEKPKNRKKGVFLLMAIFLVGGGGIFLFFILQGSEDMKKGSGNFSYGTVVRDGVSSFFRSVGSLVVEDEDTNRKNELYQDKLRARAASAANINLSDWMGKAAPEGRQVSSPAAARAASSGPPTSVPKMSGGGRGGGVGGGGGGGTKSSGGASRFAGGTSGDNLKLSGGADGQGGAGTGKGTLGSLRNAQATLKEGLRSSSAMTAKNKWDQSFSGSTGGSSKFGSGSAGGGSVSAYGKSGLVSLDTIKSGEITSLKTTEASAPAASSAKMEKDPTKTAQQDMASVLANKVGGNLSTSKPATPAGPSNGEDRNSNVPPQEVQNELEQNSSYCKDPCPPYEDSEPEYTKNGDDWTASFEGTKLECTYTFVYDITGSPPVAEFNADASVLTYPNEPPAGGPTGP